MNDTGRSPLLLCLDLESGSARLANWAAGMARRCELPVHLLYVSPGHLSPGKRLQLEARLRRVVEAPFRDIEIAEISLREGIAEEVIVEHARNIDAHMILLGRRQRSAVERIYVGSTTSAVISLARRPVLVIPVSGLS